MVICVFICILLGVTLGNVRIARFRLGLASVLLVAILWGCLSARIDVLSNTLTGTMCKSLTTFGSSLFIAIVGLQSGNVFASVRCKHLWKSFACGACFICTGVVVICGIRLLDKEIPSDMLTGIFAGSLTSTPAMSGFIEIFGAESQVAVGYGLSYWIGLLLVLIAMQFLPVFQPTIQIEVYQKAERLPKPMCQQNAMLLLSCSIVLGLMLSSALPIGDTGCILVVGILFGVLHEKKGKVSMDMQSLKSLGLSLFYVGTGITAGQNLSDHIYWRAVLYGALVTVTVMSAGYIVTRFIFRFDRNDTLAILGGGMTSTPAIGTLQERVTNVNLSLYASSYVGSLITIMLFVEIFKWF